MQRVPQDGPEAIGRREAFRRIAGGAAVLAMAPLAANAADEVRREGSAMAHKVLIIVGDATETVDTLYPYFRLIEGGYEPVVAGPEKRRYNMVMHEVKPGWDITREWEGYTIEARIAFRDIKPEEYLGIFFSGGRAPEYIRDNPDLIRVTKHFFETNKPVASVCHGVEIPARAGCVKGRRMATVAKCQFDLEVCGGIFVNEPCVVDGNLVSGRTFHDHGAYMGAWMAMLDAARAKGKA
jgi:protease I